MTNRVLVAGGTGTLGQVVVDQLLASGADVRVLSRGRRRHRHSEVEHVRGDLRTGAGLDAAVSGVDTIVQCAEHVQHLVAAARRAGCPHLLYTSIVGIDRILGPFRRKLADEQLIATSGLPWTVLRATQFHDLIAVALRMLAKSPVLALPAGWSFQPVDVREVGDRLARLALGEPAGRAPDFGGPQVRAIPDLARSYLAMTGKRRPILPVWLPGRVFHAYRAGSNLTPEHADGTISFEQYLTEQLAAGDVPYGDAIHDYLHLRRSQEPQ
jgi:uncharacterized protein YbjT (DUF2867 family)